MHVDAKPFSYRWQAVTLCLVVALTVAGCAGRPADFGQQPERGQPLFTRHADMGIRFDCVEPAFVGSFCVGEFVTNSGAPCAFIVNPNGGGADLTCDW